MRSWTTVGIVFLMFAAAGDEAAASDEVVFTDFDTDNSSDLNENEFNEAAV